MSPTAGAALPPSVVSAVDATAGAAAASGAATPYAQTPVVLTVVVQQVVWRSKSKSNDAGTGAPLLLLCVLGVLIAVCVHSDGNDAARDGEAAPREGHGEGRSRCAGTGSAAARCTEEGPCVRLFCLSVVSVRD